MKERARHERKSDLRHSNRCEGTRIPKSAFREECNLMSLTCTAMYVCDSSTGSWKGARTPPKHRVLDPPATALLTLQGSIRSVGV